MKRNIDVNNSEVDLMPHEPRKVEKFSTQMRSMERLEDRIRQVIYDLGTDPDIELVMTHNEGFQRKDGKTQQIVFFHIAFKVYYYPDKEHWIAVEKKVDWFDRAIDCGAAIYKWLHGRLMNLVHGLETIEEAFGANMNFKQSQLPDHAMKRLMTDQEAPFNFEKMLK